MYEIHVKGILTSKRAIHVPVIRRWRIVWERRDFGTQIDRIDRRYPLWVTNWAELPESGIEIKLPSFFTLVLTRRVSKNQGDGLEIVASVFCRGVLVPGTTRQFPIRNDKRVVAWRNVLWKGVKLDAEATVYYSK